MKKITDTVVILLLIGSCFAGVFTIVTPSKVSAYTPHDPILIDGDADFASQATAEGWPGDGSEGNPYVIEGYEINLSSEEGIMIKATNVNFIIRNVYIHSGITFGGIGIYLLYVTNSTVYNCTIENNWIGLFLGDSNSNNISNNNFLNNRGYEMFFEYSNNNSINENFIFKNENDIFQNKAIYLEDSIHNFFSGNTMVNGGFYIRGSEIYHFDTHNIDTSNTANGKPIYYWKNRTGGTIPYGAGQVFLVNCTNISIRNQVLSNASVGIMLAYSSKNEITGVIASNNELGIYLFYSDENMINNNNVSNNDGGGIRIICSNENSLTNNNIFSNSWDGIYLFNSNGNNLTQNNVTLNSHRGIHLYNSSNNNLNSNNVSSNEEGIGLDKSNNNTIVGNYACNNMHEDSFGNIFGFGISLDNSKDNQLFENNLSNDYYGIRLSDSDANHIVNNTVFSNSMIGIELTRANQNVFSNNDIFGNKDGLSLHSSSINLLINNTFTFNIRGIIIGWSDGNNITGNNLSSNFYCGILLIGSGENNILDNFVYNNTENGVVLAANSHDNLLMNNNILDNANGTYLMGSDENRFMGNDINLNKEHGIYLWDSDDNTFHHNIIRSNVNQLLQEFSENEWHDGNGTGNYWSDYTGIDTDGDGVGDTKLPHQGVDYYPLTDKRGTNDSEKLQPILIIMMGIILIIILALLIRKSKPTIEPPPEESQDNSWMKETPPGIKGLR